MNQDYPELQQLLAAYFNQDWVDDHKSANDVIDFFISEADSDTITKVQIEIDKLIISKKTEQELKDFLFEKIGCYYYYSNEWKDGRTCLRHVASTLTHSQSSKNVPPSEGLHDHINQLDMKGNVSISSLGQSCENTTSLKNSVDTR